MIVVEKLYGIFKQMAKRNQSTAHVQPMPHCWKYIFKVPNHWTMKCFIFPKKIVNHVYRHGKFQTTIEIKSSSKFFPSSCSWSLVTFHLSVWVLGQRRVDLICYINNPLSTEVRSLSQGHNALAFSFSSWDAECLQWSQVWWFCNPGEIALLWPVCQESSFRWIGLCSIPISFQTCIPSP